MDILLTDTLSSIGTKLQERWLELHARYTETQLILGGTILIANLVYFGFGFLMLFIDMYRRPELLYRYKIQPDKPFKFERSDYNKATFGTLMRRVIIGQGPCALAFGAVYVWFGSLVRPYGLGVHASPELPSLSKVFQDLLVYLIIQEVVFYYLHRLFHQKAFWWIHKVHHEFHAPIALAANYAHPIEVVVANIFPLLLGPFLMGSHCVQLWAWMGIGLWSSQVHHSGYRMPWTPLFDQQPNFHDFHHSYVNCNYGTFGFLDWFHGTDGPWQRHKRERALRIGLSAFWSKKPIDAKKE